MTGWVLGFFHSRGTMGLAIAIRIKSIPVMRIFDIFLLQRDIFRRCKVFCTCARGMLDTFRRQQSQHAREGKVEVLRPDF